MNVLSIWWGYASGAALFSDDRIIFASSEERFSRKKNTSSFPKLCVAYILDNFNCSIDKVVYVGNDVGVDYLLCDKGSWTVKDYIAENCDFWRDHLTGTKNSYISYLDYLKRKNKLNLDTIPGDYFWRRIGIGVDNYSDSDINKNFNDSIINVDFNFTHTSPILNLSFETDLNSIKGWWGINKRYAPALLLMQGAGLRFIPNPCI
jgi:hypothetical protein